MRGTWCIVIALAIGAAGCLRGTEYRCSTNSECGAGGTCESVGFCSFPDTHCTSGERFGDSAGALANQCTGTTGIDGGIDTPMLIDSPMIDTPPAGCPGNYATITGGQGTHRYRLNAANDNWMQQRDFCAATTNSAYLAIPDDLAELQAIATLAAQARFWVGITDSAIEGTWLNTKGTVQTFLPWETGSPNTANNNQDDCVQGLMATSQFRDERCNMAFVGVCECEP